MTGTSRRHYEIAQEIAYLKEHNRWPYYALIQAAMRLGDSDNQAKLKAMWPEIWTDLRQRYDAPGGVLPTDPMEYKAGHELTWTNHMDRTDVVCECGWAAQESGSGSIGRTLEYQAIIHLALAEHVEEEASDGA